MPVGAGSVNSQCMGSSVRCQSPTAYERGEDGAYNWHVHCADVAIYKRSGSNLHHESFSLW